MPRGLASQTAQRSQCSGIALPQSGHGCSFVACASSLTLLTALTLTAEPNAGAGFSATGALAMALAARSGALTAALAVMASLTLSLTPAPPVSPMFSWVPALALVALALLAGV